MMALSDDELRRLVRQAIARVRAGRPVSGAVAPDVGASPAAADPGAPVAIHIHASHLLLPLGPGGDADGNCVIEPAVRCTHCGFCQSFGH